MAAKKVTVQLPEGIKSIRYEDEPMVGDYLLIEFDNGLTLGVDALHLSDNECSAVVYWKRVPDEGRYDVLGALGFGTDRRPDPVVYNEEWDAYQRERESKETT